MQCPYEPRRQIHNPRNPVMRQFKCKSIPTYLQIDRSRHGRHRTAVESEEIAADYLGQTIETQHMSERQRVKPDYSYRDAKQRTSVHENTNQRDYHDVSESWAGHGIDRRNRDE
jgi:hypothetical protein